LLTQQEQAALRVCLRIELLTNGINQLVRYGKCIEELGTFPNSLSTERIKQVIDYLENRAETALTSYTVPSLPKLVSTNSPVKV